MPSHWILKTEPPAYPFARLLAERRTVWDGISNALALRHLRAMAAGDRALIYHSGGERALVGLARISRAAYPDPRLGDPKRVVVEVTAERPLPRRVPLAAIKADPALAELGLVRQSRLSVVPVAPGQWRRLLAMAGASRGASPRAPGARRPS
ncbi:MAG TPA: EVE domain-containing protein [Gemmatimonadales bacterium]|nr:EVE domain-containing protein [Gemmatimonadales bacterium]